MKIDNATLEILRNFAAIQDHLVVKAGKPISTISDSNSILAVCDAVTFPADMGIYDLKQFLGTLSLCEEPSLEFTEEFALVKDAKSSKQVKYYFSEPSNLKHPKTVGSIKVDNPDVSFKLSVDHQKQILKAASVLSKEKVQFLGRTNECIKVVVGDTTDPTSNSFQFDLEEKCTEDFSIIFALENWKMLPLEYEVLNTKQGISCFNGPGIRYFVGQDKSSTYGAQA